MRNWEWIKKGVPIRVELGPRDLEKDWVASSRRSASERQAIHGKCRIRFSRVRNSRIDPTKSLPARADEFRDAPAPNIDNKEEFYDFFTPKNPAKPEIHGGFALAHWNGSREVEEKIKRPQSHHPTHPVTPVPNPGAAFSRANRVENE